MGKVPLSEVIESSVWALEIYMVQVSIMADHTTVPCHGIIAPVVEPARRNRKSSYILRRRAAISKLGEVVQRVLRVCVGSL